MNAEKLKGNIQQFVGIDCLFIGEYSCKDPAMLILQEDLKSITILALDKALENRLPRGNVTLFSKVKAVFWSPFRQGLAVIYES